jgi:DNA-binding NarL/FixJ family response regulator
MAAGGGVNTVAAPLRLALADDQALVRSGLSALLGGFPQLQVLIEAGDGGALLTAIESQPVDVILSDIRMPGLDGFALLDRLRERGDTTPVILLTTFDEPDLALRAAAAGARGFLLKDASPEDLFEAITRVARGETLLAPVPTDPVRARYAYRDQTEPTDTFSEREVSILRLLAGGYSNREIAKAVFLSEGTVKNYVSEILDKLGTRDRTRAVLKAITLKII